ncbi:MAG: rhodanese-like domain-containing protein [Pseudomonadota bacterium]|nr:rhodanese-like domain-containing protein [Pseudomonadota bacterium]
MKPGSLGALILLFVASITLRGEDAGKIAATELAEWLDRADAPLILDVRGRGAYREGTIADALDAGQDPAGFLPDSRGGDVVLVLPEGASAKSWRARLADYGYRVQVLAGGMPGWRAAGLPEERPEVSYTRPGTVPFVIPKGLCELNEPSHTFD